IRLSRAGGSDLYCSCWLPILPRRHLYPEQPQPSDGQGGDQLQIQLGRQWLGVWPWLLIAGFARIALLMRARTPNLDNGICEVKPRGESAVSSSLLLSPATCFPGWRGVSFIHAAIS